ncbi:MAG: 3-deoxy-manno-octulosonate cytidylyltransferase [Deltaproteobacteria bacterium]|nr:3-deoxy-manno-octulosonate cytidylyltransferase [Deltaproteobacteria bacterium]
MSVCIVIPARLGSTRLPEKALADIHGKPMIQWVYERAARVKGVDEIVVATDHARIAAAVHAFGGKAALTPESLASGTDRVAHVAREMREERGSRAPAIFVNVQGDEPQLDPASVERSLELVRSGCFPMATPAAPLKDEAALKNPNVVKALVAADGRAVYFSRYPIPYSRGEIPRRAEDLCVRHHLGVYVYTTETLLKFAALPKCPWEAAESLEQLRALFHGIPIGAASADRATTGVDTAEDLEIVRRAFEENLLS